MISSFTVGLGHISMWHWELLQPSGHQSENDTITWKREESKNHRKLRFKPVSGACPTSGYLFFFFKWIIMLLFIITVHRKFWTILLPAGRTTPTPLATVVMPLDGLLACLMVSAGCLTRASVFLHVNSHPLIGYICFLTFKRGDGSCSAIWDPLSKTGTRFF